MDVFYGAKVAFLADIAKNDGEPIETGDLVSLSFSGVDETLSSSVPIFKVSKTSNKNDPNIVGVAYKHFSTSLCAQNAAQTTQQTQNQSQSSLQTAQNTTEDNTSLSETRHPELQQNSSPSNTTASANSVTSITGNVVSEVELQTDLSNILEPESNTTQNTSVVPLPQLTNNNLTNETNNQSTSAGDNTNIASSPNAAIAQSNLTNETINNATSASGQPQTTQTISNVDCDSSKIYKGEQLIVATHNSITFLKASNENGKILPGDYLTASSKAGYAAKADDNSIVLIGRALEPLNTTEGKISAFIQITTKNPILDFNKERLLEEEEQELEELEEKYDIDLEDIKKEKAKQKTRLERTKEKLLTNVTVSTAATATPQIDYMTKVNGSIILRLG